MLLFPLVYTRTADLITNAQNARLKVAVVENFLVEAPGQEG
jgi:hypothetical protein